MSYINGHYTDVEPGCLVECSYNTSRGIGRVIEKVRMETYYDFKKWLIEWENGSEELMHDEHIRKVILKPVHWLRSVA